jgi:N-acetylglucosaminyltransferase
VIARLPAVLPIVFGTYGAIVLGYLALQALFADRSRRAARPASRTLPSVDVIVPCYNEDPAVLAACLASIGAQDYAGTISVYMVDDGSPNWAELAVVYADFERRPGYRSVRLPANRGKRYAQVAAITGSDGDIVISVDSDTLLATDAVRLIAAVFDDARVGAVMGEIGAANESANWLTRLLDRRYWYASNQVSAALSHFGAVLCCCGPFSAYRRTVLDVVLDDYLNQRFMGRPTTHGEDRYLTNLVLRTGMRTAYAHGARARTVVPDRMRPFLRQQLRWNRTNYRDTWGIISRLPSFGPYVMLDAVVQVIAPPLLAATLILLAVHALTHGGLDLIGYAAGLAVVGLGYSGYGWWRERSLRALRMTWYGVLHIGLLLVSRAYALCTLSDDRWGQRGASLHIDPHLTAAPPHSEPERAELT